MYRVDFASIPWTDGRPGVRLKTYRQDNKRLRLVEFATGGGDPHWCEDGPIGYVLFGGLTMEFQGSTDAHRRLTIVPGTRLLMVEEIK